MSVFSLRNVVVGQYENIRNSKCLLCQRLKRWEYPGWDCGSTVTHVLCAPYDVQKSEFGGIISETTKQVPEPLQPRGASKILKKCFEIVFGLL